MRGKKTLAAGLTLLFLLLAGCGSGNNGKDSGAAAGNTASSADISSGWDIGFGGEAAPMEPSADEQGTDSSVYQNAGAKLVRRAEFSIQTEQFDQTVQALDRLVSECGGYFETASVRGGSYRDASASRWGEYVVRVPAERYSDFFNSAGTLGYITESSESSEDVGERYYDAETRLKTQRTKQERLLALLEQANTMEDIISLRCVDQLLYLYHLSARGRKGGPGGGGELYPRPADDRRLQGQLRGLCPGRSGAAGVDVLQPGGPSHLDCCRGHRRLGRPAKV